MKKLYFVLILFILFSGGILSQNRLLFEGCTGTWCGYCPCGHEILEQIMVQHPNTLAIEYHGPASSSDPWIIFNGNEIINLLGYTAYPRAAIGRREGNLNRAYWWGAVNNQVNLTPAINFSFTHNYNPVNRQLTVNASATSLRTIDSTVMISFVITEENLVYYQSSYSGCPPGGSNYVHKYVCRSMVNGALGDTLSTGIWGNGVTKTKSWTTTLNSGWNAANCNIALFTYCAVPGALLNGGSPVLQTSKGSVIPVGTANTGEILEGFSLQQNYPNPFNPVTNIKFTIDEDAQVSIKVYNSLGMEVTTLVNQYLKKGAYNTGFNGTQYSSGIYYYQLSAGNKTETRKMMLVK